MISVLKLLSELAQLLRLLLRQFSNAKRTQAKLDAKRFETLSKAVAVRRRIRNKLPDADGLPDSQYRRD